MKRIVRLVCLVVVLALLLALPVLANDDVAPCASLYLSMYGAYLYRTSGTTFQIWFDVDGNGTMDKLGVSTIVVERYNSSDGDWDVVRTYYAEDYPEMICENTGSHVGHVECSGSSRHEYRAYVTFYGEDERGFGESSVFAYFI